MACLVEGKYPGLAIISVSRSCIRIHEKRCLLGVNRNNNSNTNRLSFDASKTGGCKPTRIVREDCGSTEPGIVLFWVPTLNEAVPPPPGFHHVLYLFLISRYR